MKLRRKLLAAGFAFGATALTLTTSTFAWYTSNTEATVAQISGMTSATADNNSFYVAAADTYEGSKATNFTDYGSKVTPTVTGSAIANHVMQPVSYTGKVTTIDPSTKEESTATTDTNYVPMLDAVYKAGDTPDPDQKPNTVRYGAYDANKVYEYVLRFQKPNADGTTPLYFSQFELNSDKNDTYVDQVALASGAGTGITAAGVYFADLTKAMKLTIKTQNLKASSAATAVQGYEADGDATSVVYDLSSFENNADENISTADAVGYYNKVLNRNISGTATSGTAITKDTASATNALAFTTIPASGYVEVTFTFWLDGWDSYCYDIMQQQVFDFKFEASTSSAKSVIHTTA